MPNTDLIAPRGKYRVVGVDTFASEDWVEDDFDNVEDAIERADEKGGSMTLMHVYDDAGNHLHQAGTH